MHKNGVKITESSQKNLTFTQKLFLSLMAAEEIRQKNTFMAKFDALCKANGVKIPDDDNDTSTFRGQMLEKMRRNHGRINDGR